MAHDRPGRHDTRSFVPDSSNCAKMLRYPPPSFLLGDYENQPSLFAFQDLVKTYSEGGHRRRVLDCVNVDIFQGEFLVMLGKSGSGKSTLLNMLSGIDTPDGGKVLIDGIDITAMSDTGQTLFRRDNIGIIFQFFNLIPTLTVLENITLPQELRGGRRVETLFHARDLLERIGLSIARIPSRTNLAEANSNGLPLPERWFTNPRSCWRTSRPAILTKIPGNRSCSFCSN